MSFFRKFIIGRDDSGQPTSEIPWPSFQQSHKIKLLTGVPVNLAVPNEAYRVKFTVSPGGIMWIGHGNGDLELAPTDNFAQEASELNPIIRSVFDYLGDRISVLRFISENDAFLNVIFYGKNDSDPLK